MSNIYWMNTIRRKQNTGSGKKYFDFRFDYHAIMWFWGNTEQSHPFDGDDGLSIVVGAQKNELYYNSPGVSTNIEPITGKARNNGQYSFRTIVDPESYQYIFFPIPYSNNTEVNQFIDLFTSDDETFCGLQVPRSDIASQPRLHYDICLPYFSSGMTLYPYLLEYTQQGGTITNRILRTYSFVSPSQHIISRVGNEPVILGIGDGISIYLDELRVSRSNYRSMLSNIWSNYTAQLPQPSYAQFGFMGIARGNTPSSLTPKNSIKWFLQRVTDVDVNTQWTHAQLS